MLSEFFQVRGTPASGKSTLAKLLSEHIKAKEPYVHVIWIDGWNLGDVEKSRGWQLYLENVKGWIPEEETAFIFDEAQLSYNDMALWMSFFKGIHDYRKRRAIAFASYGSPLLKDIEGTPFPVPPGARVSLVPTISGDNLPAAGLLFTRAEFNELVFRQYPSSEFLSDSSFLDKVFEITDGHVGAMYSFLNTILGSRVCTFFFTRS